MIRPHNNRGSKEVDVNIFPGIIVALIAGLAIVAVAGSVIGNKKRTKAWKQAATDLGLPFRGKDNDVLTRFGHLKTFKQGHSRRVTNAIVGNTGEMEIAVADYEYTDGGENSCTHHQTICILRSQGLRLPHCFLRPDKRLSDLVAGQQEKFHFEADNDMLLFHTGRKVKPQETRRLMEVAIEIKSVLESRGERV